MNFQDLLNINQLTKMMGGNMIGGSIYMWIIGILLIVGVVGFGYYSGYMTSVTPTPTTAPKDNVVTTTPSKTTTSTKHSDSSNKSKVSSPK